ncbi:MAG TPA: glycosyltransferase [Solirubrobacteraceae bacterium]|nr:glycosyltransferase [Solirubrobacteraceae bacterium]
MTRVLFVHNLESSFIEIDRRLLEQRFDVEDWYQPRPIANPLAILRAVARCDVVVGWWAHWHTFLPITFAWLLRKPSLLIVGGFDIASIPEIGYGHQRGGVRKWISRWTMHRARRLATNSYYSQGEVERNVGISADRVAVMHHGLPDPFGELPAKPSPPVALTVGIVDRVNLERKGHRPFVEAAARLPGFSFVLAGRSIDDAADELRARSTDNVELTGWIEDDELLQRYRQAAVYVQASQHEGFGMSVAEAMLAGAIPVVTAVGALPEVVGDLGVQVRDADPDRLAAAIAAAAEMGPEAAAAARERILREFSLEQRGRSICALVDGLL